MWDEDQILGWVLGLALYGDSLLLVLDGTDHAIKVFDWPGEPVGRIGREGGGPGEFRNPGSVRVRNDTIFVTNAATAHLILLNISGEELARFTVPPITLADGTRSVRGPSGMFPDGTFFAPPQASRPYLMKELSEYPIPILKVGRTGEVLDTLGFQRDFTGKRIRLPEVMPEPYLLPTKRRPDILTFSAALGVVAVAEPSPEGPDDHYRITAIHHTGDTIFSRLYPFQPQRIRREMRTTLALRFGRLAEESRRLREAFEGAYAAWPHHPPVSDISIDRDGRYWVGREAVPGEPILWEVLSAQGEPQFRVEAPEGVRRIRLASGDHVWAVERDDLGVAYIVRYRILFPG
ncbi:6-bladed beta-propeller [Gemmatimonadota bacterium]